MLDQMEYISETNNTYIGEQWSEFDLFQQFWYAAQADGSCGISVWMDGGTISKEAQSLIPARVKHGEGKWLGWLGKWKWLLAWLRWMCLLLVILPLPSLWWNVIRTLSWSVQQGAAASLLINSKTKDKRQRQKTKDKRQKGTWILGRYSSSSVSSFSF